MNPDLFFSRDSSHYPSRKSNSKKTKVKDNVNRTEEAEVEKERWASEAIWRVANMA